MKKFQKLLAVLLSVITIGTGVINLVGCGATLGDLTSAVEEQKSVLPAPTGLRIEQGALCWNPVEHASKYTVSVDGREYYAEDYRYPLTGVSDGDHIFKVKAVGDDLLYKTSGWSDEYEATIKEGAVSKDYAYKDFVNLSENESYLGYGFDVINSAVFSDKYVKTSFPIFDNEGLMQQRLVKVDSKQTYVEEIKSSSMEEFIQSWNANAHVNVSWGKKKIGGSVDVDVKYSGGVENAKSKYFHSISFYNQEFYIVMQSDLSTYKSILNEGFMSDLYSDMDPAVFFDRYGTHFITSAVMGGRIDSHYLYSSEQEKSYHDISGKVSVNVRAWAATTNVDVSGGYRQEATSQNIDIKNTLEVIGGGDFGMISDSDIAGNYLEWEKSLDEHAALMGIKDTGSLIPLWELIDATKDTKTYTFTNVEGEEVTGSRAQQLEAYFLKYGVEAYNDLMVNSGLPEIIVPEEIDNVRVNNQLPTNNEYEVFAGAKNDISFTVLPEKATGYTKTASLTTESEYATINNENGLSLDIAPNCPHNTVLQVVLSAGSVRKTINVRVVRNYTVTFESNCDMEIEPYYNVRHGKQIDKPQEPVKEGYIFSGWYTDPNFAEGTEYKFGSQAIVDNITLYAKWVEYYPTITFIHNVDGCDLLTANVKYNTAYAKPTKLTTEAAGYELEGYYANEEMTIAYDFSTQLKQDITIYVKWQVKTLTITFDSMGGSAVSPMETKWGTRVDAPTAPAREGWIFQGWYTDINVTEGSKFNFETTLVKENITLYAKWTEYMPTVTFIHNVDGCDLLMANVKYNTAYVKPNNLTTEAAGYELEGYYADEAMTLAYDFSTQLKQDITIYVKWQVKTVALTFDSMGGTAVAPIETKWGTRVDAPTAPTKEGWIFQGWYTDINVTEGSKFNFETMLVKENMTLYAKWAEYIPTITFVHNVAGCDLLTANVKYNTTYAKPTNLTNEGHTVAGYYADKAMTLAYDFNSPIKTETIIYVKWTPNLYTVTFDSVGGTAVAKQENVAWGTKASEPLTPTKTGYVFSGWYQDAEYGNVFDFEQNVIKSNVTLYAKWLQDPITISFVSNNGETVEERIILKGDALGVNLPEITKAYYTFEGWYADETYTERVYGTTTFTKNTTLYAKWSINTYTITYNANNGEMSGTYTTEYCLGTAVVFPTAMRTHYTFDGWYTDSACTVKAVEVELQNAPQNVALYAKWNKVPYTITYNLNGGVINSDKYTTTYQVGDSVTLATVIKNYHTFDGWYNGSTKVSEETLEQNPRNITLDAKLTKITYTITYTANGGSLSGTYTKTYQVGDTITLPTATRNYYTFGGWFTNSACTTAVNTTTLKNAPQNITLYAKWTAISYKITLEEQGGNAVNDITYQVGDTITLPTPTRTYYTFGGWFTNSACTTAVNTTTLKNAPQNITLYAKWTKNTYTITYNTNDGSLKGTYTTKYQVGDTITLPKKDTNISRTYYTFDGWYTDSGYKTPVNTTTWSSAPKNITLYAKWTKTTYKITLNENGGTTVGDISYTLGQTVTLPITQYKTYAKYNKFVYWYETDGAAFNPAELKTAPRNITLTAKWDLVPTANIYTNIAKTPQITCGGRVIVDWSTTSAGEIDYVNAVTNNGSSDRYGGGNTNLDISKTDEVIFIGNPDALYTRVYIFFCNYQKNDEVKLVFDNFNMKGSVEAWEGPEVLNVTIESVGTSSVLGEGEVISAFSHLNLIGNGTLTLKTVDVSTVTNGYNAIDVNNVKVDMPGGTLKVYGGTGFSGPIGCDGGVAIRDVETLQLLNGNITLQGGDGGGTLLWNSGGNGNYAITGNSVYIASGVKYTITGGKGGQSSTSDNGSDALPINASKVVYVEGNKQYTVYRATKTWKEAQAAANAVGEKLVSINSAAEQAIITKLVEHNGQGFWIGLVRSGTNDNVWVWEDATKFTYNGGAYENWNDGEPNNSDGVEDYIQVWGVNAAWNDLPASSTTIGYITEKDL